MSNRKNPKKSWLTKRRGARIQNERVTNPAKIDLPPDEKEVLKIVPAMINGQSIGDAIVYDDGSVEIMVSPDADPELVAILQGELKDFNVANDTTFNFKELGIEGMEEFKDG